MRRSDSSETHAPRRVSIGQREQIDVNINAPPSEHGSRQILPLRTKTRRRLRQNIYPGDSDQSQPPISPYSAELGLSDEEAVRSRQR